MRSDIVPGEKFPDYELSDHTGKHRKLSESAESRTRLLAVILHPRDAKEVTIREKGKE